jgi:hypothetical protein
MARKVFFSFEYSDVQRAMIVRKSNAISADEKVYIDKADIESVERQGEAAIRRWIDHQLHGTSVTVVLVGAKTNLSKWVRYEIEQSIARGNGLLTIDISQIKDWDGSTNPSSGMTVPPYPNYLWANGNGHENIGKWIDDAAKKAGR